MHEDIQKVLFSEEEISQAVSDLAKRINADYEGKNLLIIGFLKGAFVFLSDLIRQLSVDCTIDFVETASYGSKSKSSGKVDIVKDISRQIRDYDVLLVEDIVDSGSTLQSVFSLLKLRDPKSIRICTLLNKPARREKDIELSYIGLEIPDEFVVGYGMDYSEKYRSLPYIGVLKREVYS